jgi:long-chain acyl-CoA synthetase
MAEPKTLLDVFSSWRQAVPTPALIDARGGVDRRVPAADVARQVAGLAQGLHGLGVSRGDRVALISNNRPEWHIVDFALFHLGAVGVPLYPTLQPAQIGAIVADCGARVIIAENAELLAKVNEARPACPELEHLLVIDSTGEEAARALRECTASLSDAAAAEFLEGCRPSVDAFDLATLIYTSGTTGEPKGVMLTHDNFVFDAVSAATAVPWPSTAEVALVFLPLSHVLERLVDYISFLNGRSLAYCGLLESGDTMRRIRPHFFTAVPRFYEKVQERVLHEVSRAPGWKQALVRAALDEAVESARRGRRRLRYHLYDLLVYSKVRAALGGRVRFSISGGAPLSVAVGELFQGVGINVLEGYGLTETSPVIAVNRHHDPRLGTVGPPIPGVEVRVAPDGEILTRGRHVMKGYWQRPARDRRHRRAR